MDAHYDQVMRARAERSSTATRLYFGYSTVLDRSAFEEWRRQHAYEFFELPEGEIAEGLDLDLVYDFPSRWWGGRVAGLRDTPGSSVFGRVFEIPDRDWPIVQHKEGFITHMCVEREVRLRRGGDVLTATAFTTAPDRRRSDGEVSTRFQEALLRGARSAGLPEAYLKKLAAGGA